jgi:hypothetical protein
MKKVVMLLIILTFVFVAGAVYAVTECTNGCTGIEDYRASKNVKVFVEVSTGLDTYAAVSGHKNGDRMFAGGSSSPKIYYKSKDTGTDVTSGDCPDAPATTTDTSVFSGWSEL